jgi:hypothetical protein
MVIAVKELCVGKMTKKNKKRLKNVKAKMKWGMKNQPDQLHAKQCKLVSPNALTGGKRKLVLQDANDGEVFKRPKILPMTPSPIAKTKKRKKNKIKNVAVTNQEEEVANDTEEWAPKLPNPLFRERELLPIYAARKRQAERHEWCLDKL